MEKKLETTIMGYIGVYIGIMAKKMETTIIDFQLVTCSRSFVPEVVAADAQRRGHPGLHRLGLQICALARRKDPQQKRSLQVSSFLKCQTMQAASNLPRKQLNKDHRKLLQPTP